MLIFMDATGQFLFFGSVLLLFGAGLLGALLTWGMTEISKYVKERFK